MKILMVCLGNICRSPLAEWILRQKAKESGLDWECDSAGTGAWHIGEGPDPRSVAVARKYNIDITYQRARQIGPADLDYFDLIFVMDQNNFRDVLGFGLTAGQRRKVDLIMNLVYPGENHAVPDPYWDDDGFERVFRMLEEATERLMERHRNGVLRGEGSSASSASSPE